MREKSEVASGLENQDPGRHQTLPPRRPNKILGRRTTPKSRHEQLGGMAGMRNGPGTMAGIRDPQGHRKRATAGFHRILVVVHVAKGAVKVRDLV